MNRIESIRTNLPGTADLPLDSSYEFCWQLRDDLAYLLQRLEIAQKALDDIMKIELTQDGQTMYMNILGIRNIVGMARMKISE